MAEQSTLPPSWEIPQDFRDRLGKQAGRQRAMLSEGHLLLILHRPPDPGEVKRWGRYFWRKPDGTWASSDLGAGPQALSRHLDQYAELLEKYDKQDEEAVSAEDHFAVLEGLVPVHRSARHLHETLQEARKKVSQDRDLINVRDRAHEIERTAELLYREAQHALDFTIARRAEEQAKSTRRMALSAYRLNLLAAFFFPIATLSTIFGANLDHGLRGFEMDYAPIPFLALVAFGLALGFILKSFVTEELHRPVPQRVPPQGLARNGPRTPYRKETAPPDSDRPLTRR